MDDSSMNLKRTLRTFLVAALALSFGNLSAIPSIANDPSHPSPMGLWVFSSNPTDAQILSTNYESNTVTLLAVQDTFTVFYKEVLQTGSGPIGVAPFGSGVITNNFVESSLTQFIFNGESGGIESRTLQTGIGSNSLATFGYNFGSGLLVSNFSDNSVTKYLWNGVTNEIESTTVQTDNGPIAVNAISPYDNIQGFNNPRFYWLSSESNTLQSWDGVSDPITTYLDDYLPWYEVRNGELVDDNDHLIVPIHPVGLVVKPSPMGPDMAIAIFEERTPGEPTKQHLWALPPDHSFPPFYIGEFNAPATDFSTNQRVATDGSRTYILSTDGPTNAILKWNLGEETQTIWSDAGIVAITLDNYGNLYAANSLDNTVLRFNADDQLIASYSMAPSPPPPAAPSFTLSSQSETATAGSPIAGYTIDSSAGGVIDVYDISPEISNGLTFDAATGRISGTPTSAAPAVTYTITGINVTDTATATFTISVNTASSPPVSNIPQNVGSFPDPIQMSSIDSFTALHVQNETSSVVTVYGKFIETVLNIQVDGVNIPRSSWSQTSTTLTFTVNKTKEAKFTFTVFNGAAPVLPVQSATVAPAAITPPAVTKVETPTAKVAEPAGSVPANQNPSAVKAPAKIVTIKCVRGKIVKTVKAVKPACPKGYVAK